MKASMNEPAIESNPSTGAIDQAAFTQFFADLNEDPAMLVEMLAAFLEESTAQIAALHTAVQQGDPALTYHVGHSLKGASFLLGALHLSEACKTLEQRAKIDDLSQAEALLEAVTNEHQRAAAEFKTIIQDHRSG